MTAFSLHLDALHRRQCWQDSAVPGSHGTVDFAISPSRSQLLNDTFQKDTECSRAFHSSLWLAPWPKRRGGEQSDEEYITSSASLKGQTA